MEPGSGRDARSPVQLRLTPAGIAVVDALAKGAKCSRSAMLRELIALGVKAKNGAGSAMVTKGIAPREPVGQAFADWDDLVPATKAPAVDAAGEVLPDDDWVA